MINHADLIRSGERVSQLIKDHFLPLIDPTYMVQKYIQLSDSHLRIKDEIIDLSDFSEIKVLSIGKAAIHMGLAIENILGKYFSSGLIVTKADIPVPKEINNSKFTIIHGSHPIPDQSSVHAAKSITEYLHKVSTETLIITLISGGGSALITHPRGDLTIEDLQILNKLLLKSGATINEINTIRKHCDDLKGGGLIRLAYPAKVVSLVLSDVIGNSFDVIASGMTATDPTTFTDAVEIIKKYKLSLKIPKHIRIFLEAGCNGSVPETLKSGDPKIKGLRNYIVGDVTDAMEIAKEVLLQFGLKVELDFELFGCDTDKLAKGIYEKILDLIENNNINCLLMGGESTVNVTGSGLGGRNQDLALRLVPLISGMENIGMITLTTDGIDGPTDAAGAIITGQSAQRAIDQGLDVMDYLLNNDSYHFFELMGDQIKIGATGTNLNDLVIIFKIE